MTEAQSLLDRGVAAHKDRRFEEAERFYRGVLAIDPDHADACALLGVVIGTCGRFEEAIEWVNRAVSLDPSSGLLRFHQGTVLMAALHMDEAITALRRALMINPAFAPAHFNLANGLRAMGLWDEAITEYRESLRLDPTQSPTYNNLALSLVYVKEYDEALNLSHQALALDPAYGDGWLTLCNVAEKLKDYDLALSAGLRATELTPANHYAWFGYGLALNRLNRDEEALAAYQRAASLNPDSVDVLDNMAQTYQSLNRLEEAESVFVQAVKAAGQDIADEDGRQVDEQEYGNRHWHLALIQLLRGHYSQGFARYRARLHAIEELKRPVFAFPLWTGQAIAGKSLLVCDEQGYGDTLMLARFLPVLKQKGVRVAFRVHPVLVPFFRGWAGADVVIGHGDIVPPCDYFCSSFDLPFCLGVTLETLPRQTPYLPVLPPDEATLLPVSEAKKIGVVWGGSPLHLADHKRSIPLRVFADLFTAPRVKFFSFNRDLKAGDADLLPSLPVRDLVPLLKDFSAAARLAGQMDLIITCDTATAHLAGGLGKPVWVLLPFAPDWRWLTERDDSAWYPSMRLFRQPNAGDWHSVIKAVKQALSDLKA